MTVSTVSIVSITNVGRHGPRYVPEVGVTVEEGAAVVVSEQVAGREPGPWETRSAPVEGWPCQRADDGPDGPQWLVQDPGEGLLAQPDVWVRTPVPASTATPVPVPVPALQQAPTIAPSAPAPVPPPPAAPAAAPTPSTDPADTAPTSTQEG